MDRKDKEESRRHFLAAIGVDAAALLVPATLIRPAFGQVCAPPGNTSNPTPWVRDCRSIQARRPASTLTGSEVTKLKAAYKAMRDLAPAIRAIHADFCTRLISTATIAVAAAARFRSTSAIASCPGIALIFISTKESLAL